MTEKETGDTIKKRMNRVLTANSSDANKRNTKGFIEFSPNTLNLMDRYESFYDPILFV